MMNLWLWLRNLLSGARLERETREYLAQLQRAPMLRSQRAASKLLGRLKRQSGPKVPLGETMWGEPVLVPLRELVKACSLVTGGMGTGKTMFALLPIRAIIELLPSLATVGFGVLDPKTELFERSLYLVAKRLAALDGAERAALRERIVVIDFSSRSVVSPYNILAPWPGAELDFFVRSRLETLRELFPASEKLSLRGCTVLKNVLTLLAEFRLPLTILPAVLSDDVLRHRLVARTRNEAVRCYFQRHFPREGKLTIDALRARIESLFDSDSVRLALEGSTAPDFRQLQNEGKIVLINCAGPMITRGVRMLLQGLVLSDIRAAIFSRPNDPPVTFLWCADEAQNFFLTRQQQDDMADVLTMARSFGSFFCFLCQNLSTAIPDGKIVERLLGNIRWSLTLRDTPNDAQFLRRALPVTGRLERPDPHPFRERTVYSPEEERSLLLDGGASLGDGIGYWWLKAGSPEAIKLRTARLKLPRGEEFRRVVQDLREDPTFGQRLSRQEYERQIRERDREWFGVSGQDAPLTEQWEQAYREQEAACRS